MSTTTFKHPSKKSLDDVLGTLIRESADLYHSKAADYLSSHALADFRKCPLLFHRKRCGLVPDEDRPAYLVGRAAHTVILEGLDTFQESFAVGGPVNPKTGRPYGNTTKAWAEWAAAQQKEVLTNQQHSLVMQMANGVAQHDFAQELLSEGVAEGVVRTEYCGVPSQIRLDWLNPRLGIVDLKTADDLTWFEADARRYGYLHQVAFYRAVLAEAIGVAVQVHLVSVEKREPYRCGAWRVAEDSLASAQRENEAAIGRLLRCEETDNWETGYEDVRLLDYV
jgi:hypothetical protein